MLSIYLLSGSDILSYSVGRHATRLVLIPDPFGVFIRSECGCEEHVVFSGFERGCSLGLRLPAMSARVLE